jgi:simple sugar transport system ATP-binding protein
MSRFLRLEAISKRYGGVQALLDATFEVESGTVHCLVGENGSGKSTLIKVATGAVRPDSGAIIVNGASYPSLTPREAIRQGIDVIYQDLSLFPNLTVADNLALPTYLARTAHRYDAREARRLATQLLDRVGVELDCDALVGELGPAQKQIVAICRALGHEARAIFMDEPTASLTWREVEALFALVRQLTESGVAVVFVSHKLDEVLDISDQLTILRNGQVVAQGPAGQFDRSALTRAMTGREGWGTELAPPATDEPVALEVRGLASNAFSDVAFTARKGEIVGFAGLLGSGATELVSALFGAPPAGSGTILVADHEVKIDNPAAAMQAGIGYVPNDRLKDGLFLRHSIGINVAAASLSTMTGKAGLLRMEGIRASGREAIDSLHIAAPSSGTVAGELSGGNQQKVVLGKWLKRSPAVLLLNGPTVGVDVGAKAEIHRLLGSLSQSGTTILVASDDVPELVALCHRVFVMKQGAIVGELSAPGITETTLHAQMVA